VKADIHPLFYEDAQVKCACGEVWTVGSTVRETAVETCGKCHPFWTGEQRIVDTEGRVERFLKRYNLNADDGGAAAVVKPKPQAKEQAKAKAAPSDNAKNGNAKNAKSAENGKNASAKDDKSDKNAATKNSKQQQSGDAPQDAA